MNCDGLIDKIKTYNPEVDVQLIEKAYETIRPHLRERQRLVDLFFEEKLE